MEEWDSLIQNLESMRREGKDSILIDSLLEYLGRDPEKNSSAAEHQRFLLGLRHASGLEQFKSVLTLAQNSLRASFILNGSASIALLAFLGNIWGATSQFSAAKGLVSSLLIFGLGVLSSAVASATTWCSQYNFALVDFGYVARKDTSKSGSPLGDFFQWASIIAAASSLFLFFAGIMNAVWVFRSVFTQN